MTIQKVTVFGAGKFGARLAFHIAFNKIDVTVYDQDYGLLEEARTKFREFGEDYRKQAGVPNELIEAALANIAYSRDIAEAAGNAHLIIESVVEDLAVKKKFYRELQKSAPPNALFTTTSRGLDPETLANLSGRPEFFLTLHFKGEINLSPHLEIIALPPVRQDVIKSVSEFFRSLGIEVSIKYLEKQD